MTIDVPSSIQVVQLIAVISRISGILFFSLPALSSMHIPLKVKAGLALIISFIMLPVLPENWQQSSLYQHLTILGIILIVFSEVLLGMVISLVVRFVLESIIIGGFIIDRNVGYAMARTVDPTLDSNSTILATFMMQIFLVIFLIFDVHLDIIRLLAFSFQEVSPGSFILKSQMKDIMYTLGSQMFSLGFKIALPIFTIILFTNIAMALMARFGQEFEVMMLSFPIRIGMGLLTMSILVPVFIHIFRKINDDMIYWMRVIFTL